VTGVQTCALPIWAGVRPIKPPPKTSLAAVEGQRVLLRPPKGNVLVAARQMPRQQIPVEVQTSDDLAMTAAEQTQAMRPTGAANPRLTSRTSLFQRTRPD